ncbi:MAG: hypothetical protein ABEN55_13660 [Bradymonadaceae bacterium]
MREEFLQAEIELGTCAFFKRVQLLTTRMMKYKNLKKYASRMFNAAGKLASGVKIASYLSSLGASIHAYLAYKWLYSPMDEFYIETGSLQCQPSCQDECSQKKHPLCVRNRLRQTCVDTDSDSCLDVKQMRCPKGQSCRNGTCGDAKCPNGQCESGETTSSCPEDCGTCTDGTCDSTETPSSCPQDCSKNTPTCGDGTCSSGESASKCAEDCCPGRAGPDDWSVVELKGSNEAWAVAGTYAHYINNPASLQALGGRRTTVSKQMFQQCYTKGRSIDGSDNPLLKFPNRSNDVYRYESGSLHAFPDKQAYQTCSGNSSFGPIFEHGTKKLFQALGGRGEVLCDPSRSKVQCRNKPGIKSCTRQCEWTPCRTSCSDRCGPTSDQRCAGSSSFRICGDHDGDSCLEWSSPRSCPGQETCKNDTCGCHSTNRKTCHNGAVHRVDSCGRPTTLVDDCDDGLACTYDRCSKGRCRNPDKPDGTNCGNGGTCRSGTCNRCQCSSGPCCDGCDYE